jgi:hypothetical protein
MPKKQTLERARRDKEEGKAPSTQAGEFVREEIDHVREGKHGARSTKQAIAIGLSKARRAGINIPRIGKSASHKTGEDSGQMRSHRGTASAKRSRASLQALKREGRSSASHRAISKQTKSAARRRRTGASGRGRSLSKSN